MKCLDKVKLNVQSVTKEKQNVNGFRSRITIAVSGSGFTHIFTKNSAIFMKKNGQVSKATLEDLKFATKIKVCIKDIIGTTSATTKRVIILESDRNHD